MADDGEEKEFVTLLIEWYSKQKKARNEPVISNKCDDNAKI